MTPHRTIRLVERNDHTGYRPMSPSEIQRMLDRGAIRLEGVDGDEDTNTVTRWYSRDV